MRIFVIVMPYIIRVFRPFTAPTQLQCSVFLRKTRTLAFRRPVFTAALLASRFFRALSHVLH